jgi:hypothetical protein
MLQHEAGDSEYRDDRRDGVGGRPAPSPRMSAGIEGGCNSRPASGVPHENLWRLLEWLARQCRPESAPTQPLRASTSRYANQVEGSSMHI